MSTVVMVSVSSDVPFETDDEIALRLARYEDLFKHRYTEADDWYSRTCQRNERWYQVPVMNPWPPKRGYGKKKRYEDLDSGPHRRGGYYSGHRNRDRGGPVYPPRDKYSHHEPHSYAHSGWGRNSRSPRGGYYSNEGYGRHSRSPHRSSPPPGRHTSSWDQGHPRHLPSSPPSHDSHSHTHHHPRSSLMHPDQPHYEQLPLRSGSRSPGSFPLELGPSPTERVDYHCEPEPEGRLLSPGPDINAESLGGYQHFEHTSSKGKEDILNRSHADIEEDISSQSETDTNSVKTKAPPPPPLDLTSVIGSEEEQKLVPSQSDVMDILSIASKGSNEVTSENLRQVKKETQIHAARKTMKSRDKSSSDKSSSKVASSYSKAQKEKLLISHGHAKNVSLSRVLEGETSKPLSKTHALLQESIAAAEAEKSLTISTPTLQGSTSEASRNIDTDSKARVQAKAGVRKAAVKKKRRRSNVIKYDMCSSSENEELDVVTPDSGNASLSVSLKRDLMSESSHPPQMRHKRRDSKDRGKKHSHGKIRLSVDDLASDVSDVDEVVDTIKPAAFSDVPLWVSISRQQISKQSVSTSKLSALEESSLKDKYEHHHNSDSSLGSPSYAVEFNPKKLTKMVIRAQPCPPSEVQGHDLISDDVGKGSSGTTSKKAKKKKKKAKHKKITMSDDLKLKITF